MKIISMSGSDFMSKYLKLEAGYYDKNDNTLLLMLKDKTDNNYMLSFNNNTYEFDYTLFIDENIVTTENITTDEILKDWIGYSSNIEF